MRVLVACEMSGRVRDAFLRRGYDALSCDLFPSMSPGPHYQGDIFDILDNGWDLMVAHPPCTFLTLSGAKHLYIGGRKENGRNEQRWRDMEEAALFYNRLWNADIPRIAIENPLMHGHAMKLIQAKRSQIIHPWQHGHGETKQTGFALKNLPLLVPTNIVEGRLNRIHMESPGMKDGLTRSQRRGLTYHGIAEAIAEQWGAAAANGWGAGVETIEGYGLAAD